MTGHEYEHIVASYLSHRGYRDVEVTKGSGDYGVDVIARKGRRKYAVQCKYYSGPVSVGAIQEAVAGKAVYDCNAAMVVTNSTFTKAAEELARKNNVVLISGVKSSGSSAKGVFILFGVVITALVLFVVAAGLYGAVSTIIEQIQYGEYVKATVNIVELLGLILLLIGVPIAVKKLIKHFKNKKAVQEETDNIDCIKPTYTREVLIKAIRNYLQPHITDDTDTKIEEALFIALSEKHISAPLLQMRLKIEYSRATKIIKQMESYGIVSPSVDHKPCLLLVSEKDIMNCTK